MKTFLFVIKADEAIRYLEFCVNRLDSEDTSVHNKLLTLYLTHAPEKLLDYVKQRKVSATLNEIRSLSNDINFNFKSIHFKRDHMNA